jgi:PleD family two-component response regulator/EAL domain-containing protein (putative c-di-GMP-specific phosphodiesterase class I)
MPDQPIRILVVDDDFATRLLASEALLADGFEPLEAEDGREAIEQYDRTSPTAILLDVNMPGIDGYEVCRRIRLRPGGESTAVMVMTASDDVEAVERAFAAGATDFLTKPLNLPLLAHRVRYMLRAAATATAARATASRLARAQRLARLVHWQLGADDQLVWASDPLAVFWPDAPAGPGAEPPAGVDQLLAFVHADDRDRVAGVLAARAEHQLDFRMVFPDGSERFVHQDAELEFGEHGIVLIGATQDVTDVKRAEQQIAQLAFYDDLTGIPNRPFVERYLRRVDPAVARSAIAIDLGLGHLDRLSVAARDALIRAAAARVIERVRGTDLDNRLDQPARPIESFTGATLVARTGPDELVVITSEPTAGTAASMAHQLVEALGAPFAVAGRELVLRPRAGVADYPEPVGEPRRLAEQAQAAMQDAERSTPRNLVVVTAATGAQRARRSELAGLLAATLDAAALASHAELAVDYVPRIDPATGRTFGVRARPRWLPAEDDPQLVADLLALEPALRDRLARWTFAQASRDAGQWLSAGIALRIAVELSHTQLAHPALADVLLRRLATREIAAQFDLELVDLPSDDGDLERLAGALAKLRDAAVRVTLACIDGHSSIGGLCRLPLDALRIEHATIDRLGPAFVAMVSALARGLALPVGVIDIDAPSALAVLDAHEFHEVAGAMFGAPITAARVVAATEASAGRPARTVRPERPVAS